MITFSLKTKNVLPVILKACVILFTILSNGKT